MDGKLWQNNKNGTMGKTVGRNQYNLHQATIWGEIGTKYSTHGVSVHDCQDEQITPQ